MHYFAIVYFSFVIIAFNGIVAANNCSKLQMNEFGCKSDSDCGDMNGNALTCVQDGLQKACKCPVENECKWTPGNSSVPQFGRCSKTKPCVSGSGFSGKAKCAESLGCVSVYPKANVTLASFCHTCSTCKLQGLGRFNCDGVCPEGWKEEVEKEKKRKEEEEEEEERKKKEKEKEEEEERNKERKGKGSNASGAGKFTISSLMLILLLLSNINN